MRPEKMYAALFVQCLLLAHETTTGERQRLAWAAHARTIYGEPSPNEMLEIAARIREAHTKRKARMKSIRETANVEAKIADGTYFLWNGEWRKMSGRGTRKLPPLLSRRCRHIHEKASKSCDER